MRPQALVGIILLVIGAFILFRGMSYKSKDEVLKVGDLKASVEQKHAVPTWAGVRHPDSPAPLHCSIAGSNRQVVGSLIRPSFSPSAASHAASVAFEIISIFSAGT